MRTEEIIQDLRNRIITGEFSKTGTLPRRHILLQHYDASNMTVQRAINQLMEEGFLVSRGSKGMFLSPNPPNRFRYALVVQPPEQRTEIQDDTLWNAMENAVTIYQARHPEYSFSYYMISESGRHQPNYLRLLEDLRNGLLAGVILPRALDSDLIAGFRDYPTVIHDPKDRTTNGIKYYYDWIAMTKFAIEQLKELGARKIAVIILALASPQFAERIEKLVLESDVESCPEWIQGVFQQTPHAPWTARLIELLYKPGMPETPDGLIVLNENLLPSIVGALKRRKIKPGTDVHVISHCNIPADKPHLKNIGYIAFNFSTLLDNSIKAMENLRAGKNVTEHNPILPEYVLASHKTIKSEQMQIKEKAV